MKRTFILCTLLGISFSNYAATISNETEVGVAVAQGNTRSQLYNAKQMNQLQLDQNIISFNGRYLNAYAGDTESARYLLLSLKYVRELSSIFSLYLAQSLEKDFFAGYRSRVYSDAGFKYSFYKEEKNTAYVEAGYRYSTEKRLSNTQSSTNSLRAFGDIEKKWNENFFSQFWVEYLPNLDETDDYLFNSEISISAVINSVFSLKTGYLLRYDNMPNPGVLRKTDTLLTTAIVSKF